MLINVTITQKIYYWRMLHKSHMTQLTITRLQQTYPIGAIIPERNIEMSTI